MLRRSLLLVLLFTVSITGLLWYSYFIRSEDAAEVESFTQATKLSTQHNAIDAIQTASTQNGSSSSETVASTDTVSQWMVDAFDTDPGKRAKAIAALATAPKSEAVPVLQKVLNTGEFDVDRPLALHSLRTLALQQGDGDGGIRDVFRQAIYDGKYEAITPVAQAALADIENYLDQSRPEASR